MFNVSFVDAAAMATMTRMLNMALPTIVPTPTELDVLKVSANEVKNSGADDPAAKKVAPATSADSLCQKVQVGAQGVCASFIEWYVKVVSEYQINIIIVYFLFA